MTGSLINPSRAHLFSRAAGKLLTLVQGEGTHVWSNEGRQKIDGAVAPSGYIAQFDEIAELLDRSIAEAEREVL